MMKSILSIFAYSVLAIFLLTIAVPCHIIQAGSGSASNLYATASWNTSISETSVTRGETFNAYLTSFQSTINQIPDGYEILIDAINAFGAELTINYNLIASYSTTQLILKSGAINQHIGLGEIQNPIAAGNTISFPDQAITNLSFPASAPEGNYALFIKMTTIQAATSIGTFDATSQMSSILPQDIFNSGIQLGSITLTATENSDDATNDSSGGGGGTTDDDNTSNTTDDDSTSDNANTTDDQSTDEPDNSESSSDTQTSPNTFSETVEVAIQAAVTENTDGTLSASVTPVGKDFSTEDTSIGQVEASVDLHLSNVPQNASVKVTTSRTADNTSQSAFELAATNAGVQITQVAYTINVSKTNLQNGSDIQSAAITMKVGRAWVEANGGTEAIRIVRYDPDSGQKQVLETTFKGYDAQGRAIFEGISPNGLSVFGLVATKQIPKKYSLITAIDPAESGTISRGMDQPEGGYEDGWGIGLKAIANDGYVFDQWSGDAEGSDVNVLVKMDSDKNITAHFIKAETEPAETTSTNNINTNTTGDVEDDSSDSFPWWWIVIGAAVFGLALYFPIRKRRSGV